MNGLAAVFTAPGSMELVERGVRDEPGALIRVSACGVCGTDRRVWRHWTPRIREPRVLGHETAGVVLRSDDQSVARKGQRVVLAPPAIPCGCCRSCRRGMSNLCERRTSFGFELDGGFAEYVHVPLELLGRAAPVPIPDDVSDGLATLAEPLAAVVNGRAMLAVEPGDWVVIFGGGFIGRMFAQLATIDCGQVVLADVDERRLAATPEIAHRLNPGRPSFVEEVTEITGGRVDAIVIACSAVAAHDQAAAVAAAGGLRVLLFASLPVESSAWQPNLIHFRELTVFGAFSARRSHVVDALELIGSGALPLEKLVEYRPLVELEEVLNADPGDVAPKVVMTA